MTYDNDLLFLTKWKQIILVLNIHTIFFSVMSGVVYFVRVAWFQFACPQYFHLGAGEQKVGFLPSEPNFLSLRIS